MECVVCLDETLGQCVSPCGHGMCETCMEKWIQHGGHTCPMCRGLIMGYQAKDEVNEDTSVIDFPSGTHAGITLVNDPSGGVCVLHVDKRDRAAQCGVQRGSVLTHINSIPVRHHQIAVRFFDLAAQTGDSLRVKVGRRSHSWSSLIWNQLRNVSATARRDQGVV